MRGSAAPGRRRLRVQLRVSNMRAPYGRSFWSEPLQLDALGGAAIVSVPCPGPSPSYAQPDARAAYALSVTASQVGLYSSAHSCAALKHVLCLLTWPLLWRPPWLQRQEPYAIRCSHWSQQFGGHDAGAWD